MDYIRLGSAGLQVSRICLGMMSYGSQAERAWHLDEAAAEPIVKAAADGGITYFDTADTYSDGVTEQITGRLLSRLFDHRDDYVLATGGDLPGAEKIAREVQERDLIVVIPGRDGKTGALAPLLEAVIGVTIQIVGDFDDAMQRVRQVADRGAFVTVVLDCCHSGSGTREIDTVVRRAPTDLRRRPIGDREENRVFVCRVLMRVPLPGRHDKNIALIPI